MRQAQQKARTIALQDIVSQLNGGFSKEHPLGLETYKNLIQLVQAWQQARVAAPAWKPTLIKMTFPPGCQNLGEIQKDWMAILGFSGTGADWGPFMKLVKGKPWTAWDLAMYQFIWLITNPEREKLAGPCARCGKYYIKKRVSQKVYCSRICGNATTAVIRTRKKWDEDHREKINRAGEAQDKWLKDRKTKKPWKEYVCMKCPDISQKFLTRAVNKGELSEPTKGRN